jgi:F-type H+-transporting ATPase subunit epsilon
VAEQATPEPDLADLDVTLATGDAVLYHGPAYEVQAPALRGMIAVRPLHAPLVARLLPGEVSVVRGEHVERWAIGGGFIEVIDNAVAVMADSAEAAGSIDLARAEQRLEQALATAHEHTRDAALLASRELDVQRARAWVSVARKTLLAAH